MKKLLVLLSLVFIVVLTSCGSPVKVLVENISLGGTGDNYMVTPAKMEVTSIKMNSVVAVPITITNNDNQPKAFQFKVVSPISGETSTG
jgi:hypothetical protein